MIVFHYPDKNDLPSEQVTSLDHILVIPRVREYVKIEDILYEVRNVIHNYNYTLSEPVVDIYLSK